VHVKFFCHFLNNPQWELGNKTVTDFESQIRIHSFFIPNNLEDLNSCFNLLNEAEIKRAQSYHQLKDSQRFIIARGILKKLASQYLSIPPNEIEINIGTNKKPFIGSNTSIKLDYNISHSGNWIVIAFGFGSIGIDVEQINHSFNYDAILAACFNVEEQKFIQQKPNSTELFYRLWTRKEAFVKATSKGLDNNLPQIICLNGEWELMEHDSLSQSWETLSFSLDLDHVASLSYSGSKKNILFIKQDI
ncbi:MAG TPA: 4'-phosphopantetheinyl transferase superfamily protein, partial [Sediminibacterium sp.]|nr:4'-phosphopantetheinyl transferase superfamily protein [Sediminibacterium sp.]